LPENIDALVVLAHVVKIYQTEILVTHTPELKTAIAAGCTYVGTISSHSDETFFKRVRPPRPDPAETAPRQAG
jgi:hypothetical protein